MTIDMTYWCESCARKNYCYTIRSRPKCFTPITNTAHGTPESYLAKALRFSRDSHEIAKTEPNCSEKPNNCEPQMENLFTDKYGDVWEWRGDAWHCISGEDEPQTDTEIAKAIVHKMIDDAVIAEDAYPDLRQKMHDAVDEYEPQTDCAWK